jgi:hypothetical protein
VKRCVSRLREGTDRAVGSDPAIGAIGFAENIIIPPMRLHDIAATPHTRNVDNAVGCAEDGALYSIYKPREAALLFLQKNYRC